MVAYWELTKLQIGASRHSLSDIEIMLVMLPRVPSSALQPHITPHNYASVIDGLLPAFLLCRSIKAIRVVEHRRNREAAVVSLLSAHGVAREQALLFSLFFGLVFVISALPGGVCLLYAMPAKSD
jgi:hypothetical protein